MPKDVKDEAVEETPSPEASPGDEIDSFETVTMEDMTKEEHQLWLHKGTLPERYSPKPQGKPKTGTDPAAEAAKAKEKAKAASTEPPDKEPEDGKEPPEKKDKQEPERTQPPNRAERRIQQLSAKIQSQLTEQKTLRDSIAELKRTQAELSSASTAAKAVVVEAKETGKLKRPKMADFSDGDLYDQALEAYDNARDLDAAKKQQEAIQKAIAEDREARKEAETRAQIERENKAIEEIWIKKLDASTKRHSDFADIALVDGLLENSSGVVNKVADSTILELEHGAELLYWLGKPENEDERARIMDLGPVRTAAELGKIEARIAEGLKANGKPASDKKEPVVPRAPAPPTDLGAKKAAVEDPAEAALERGDFNAYAREMNRKEVADRAARAR